MSEAEFQAVIPRVRELEFLRSRLGRVRTASEHPRLIYMHGPEGIGKTTLLASLRQTLAGEDVQHLWLQPERTSCALQTGDLAGVLMQGLQACNPEMAESVAHCQKHFAERLLACQAGASSGPVGLAIDPVLESIDAFIQSFENSFSLEHDDFSEGKPPRTTIVLEDIDLQPPHFNRWLMDHFIQRFSASFAFSEIRFLVTSCLKPDEVPSLFDKLKDLGLPVKHLLLKPLNIDEIAQALKAHGMPQTEAIAVHRVSAGVPSRTLEAINTLKIKEALDYGSQATERLLKAKTKEQQQWLVQAAHLREVSEETLRLFNSEKETSKVFEWLRSTIDMVHDMQNNSRNVDDLTAEGLLSWHSRQNPGQFGEYSEQARRFHEISSAIPLRQDRELMRWLAPLNFFNRPLLQKLPGVPSEALSRLINERQSFFFHTQKNIRLEPEIASALQRYRALFPDPKVDQAEEALEEAWAAHQESLKKKIKDAEEDAKRNQTSLDTVTKEHERLLQQLPSRPSRRVTRQTRARSGYQPKRFLMSICLEGMGIVLLYLSFLVYSSLTLPLITLAIGLIISGILFPMKSTGKGARRTTRLKPAKPRPTPSSRQDRILELKRLNIENRLAILKQRTSRYRNTLDSLSDQLCEPYIWEGRRGSSTHSKQKSAAQ